jgi:hypothetical protein
MGILTILALMTSAVVAKPRSPDAELTRLQTRVDELERELKDIGRSVTALRLETDRWQALVERQMLAGPDFGPHHITEEMRLRMQAQHQQLAQQTQYNQGLQMAMQNQALQAQHGIADPGHRHGLLGFEGFCNCVPARHDMFLRGA